MEQSDSPVSNFMSNQGDGQTPLPSAAVGFILLNNGSLFSFGLLPPSVEARAAPGPEEWNEIKICPPTHVVALPTTKLTKCPADYCNDKINSYEEHARKHLTLILEEQCRTTRLSENCDLPASLKIGYYCNQSVCYAGLQMLDQSRGFSRMKYLRQHYLKIHAPKTFACSNCSKSFSTLGLLGGHIKSCGISFECSACQKQYNTLEALQTHCRRNDHSTDYSKYKNLIANAKSEISALRKAEKDLKQKDKPGPLPVQVIIPRPKTITCGPSGTPSHVIWTYDCGVDTPKVKTETCTQTDTEIGTPDASSSKPKSTASQMEGRKRSAETQTGKMKLKVSTEAQTLNVTKRRRTSKKQIAEAETQCSVTTSTTSRSDSDEISTPENKSDSAAIFLPAVTTNTNTQSIEISLQMLMSMVGIVGDEVLEDTRELNTANDAVPVTPNIVNVLDQQFEIGVNGYTTSPSVRTSEVCVGFDEPFNLEDFLRYELTRETQTDAASSGFHLSDPSLISFNDFVTTETQTSFVNSESEANAHPTQVAMNNWLAPSTSEWHGILDSRVSLEPYSMESEDYPLRFPQDGNINSPSYLETIDGETQTAFPDGLLQMQLDCMLPSVFDSASFDTYPD